MRLETERLVLRRIVPDDAAFVLALLNEPSFVHYIGDRGVRSLEDARRYIEAGPADSYRQHGFGMYLAQQKDGGAPAGMAGLVKRDWLPDVDIGFAFRPVFWSKGLASEAALAVLEHARRDCGLQRLAGIVSPTNLASIRVLEKLGLSFQGMVRASPGAPPLRLYARAL
jgi:RimJ/RimL family protein N-acetyltransferase